MILTNKENYNPLKLDAREVLDIKGHNVHMKDGTVYAVDENEDHIKTLMMVELTYNIQAQK